MSKNPFYSVQALVTPDNTKSIYWRMRYDYTFPTDKLVTFFVEVSDTSLGDWVTLNAANPIVDNCVYIDNVKHRYAMTSDVWYRVSMRLENMTDPTDVELIASVPTQIQGALTDKAFRMGKTILKSFYTKLKKGGGQQGFILKRKVWGDRCPSCTDFDVETVINGHCDLCYGTGIIGGYYEGIEFWVMPSTVKNRSRVDSKLGMQDDYAITAECAAYPWLDAYDIWVDAKTNERFIIKSVSHVIELERKPIVFSLSMAKIANTSISMDIPVAATIEDFLIESLVTEEITPVTDNFPTTDTEVVVSSEVSTDRGWRRGLTGDDW